jgi:hypothetical protein
MKKKKDQDGLQDGKANDGVEVVDKGPCQDCYRTDWEYAHRNDLGEFIKCDKCHIWDSNIGAMKPKVLH